MAMERVDRKLTAILAADVVGYSRLMSADQQGILERVKAYRQEFIYPKIAAHKGRIVKTTGDSMFAEFPSAIDAVRCAVEAQRAMVARNAQLPDEQRAAFRMGINLGDVTVDGDNIYSDGVNIAACLQTLAEPGGIFISRVVRDRIRDKLPYIFEDRGEHSIKNVARPVGAYAMDGTVIASLPPVSAMAHAASTSPTPP